MKKSTGFSTCSRLLISGLAAASLSLAVGCKGNKDTTAATASTFSAAEDFEKDCGMLYVTAPVSNERAATYPRDAFLDQINNTRYCLDIIRNTTIENTGVFGVREKQCTSCVVNVTNNTDRAARDFSDNVLKETTIANIRGWSECSRKYMDINTAECTKISGEAIQKIKTASENTKVVLPNVGASGEAATKLTGEQCRNLFADKIEDFNFGVGFSELFYLHAKDTDCDKTRMDCGENIVRQIEKLEEEKDINDATKPKYPAFAGCVDDLRKIYIAQCVDAQTKCKAAQAAK